MGVNDKSVRMCEEQSRGGEIIIRGRREMQISGVEDVVSFDEEGIKLITVDGELYIDGAEIKVGTLDTKSGVVNLNGRINGLYYALDTQKNKKGFWGKVMR